MTRDDLKEAAFGILCALFLATVFLVGTLVVAGVFAQLGAT